MDDTNFKNYDKLMKACLDTGSYCMIDIHNFARWNDGIIGQGGPEDEDFVDIWVQLAKKYADNDKVMFGIVNEPHDLDIVRWAETCQKVVTGIRKAGAESQIILLPGTNFASAETFVSSGSAELLADISNPDGSKHGLVLDLHKYLDINNSGTHMECTTDNVEGFKTITDWLRKNKRKAIISETGASLDPTVRFTEPLPRNIGVGANHVTVRREVLHPERVPRQEHRCDHRFRRLGRRQLRVRLYHDSDALWRTGELQRQ
jgi:endoglucanase